MLQRNIHSHVTVTIKLHLLLNPVYIGVLTAAMIGTTVVLVVMLIMAIGRNLFGREEPFLRSQSASPQQGPDELVIGHQ